MNDSRKDRRSKLGKKRNLDDYKMLPTISNLKKDTLEATFENINRVLKYQSGENYDNVKEFIEYNDNLNVFEKKVQAIIIDSLRIKEGVVSCLLSGDVNLIRRVLKCDWFFQDALSPEFYENTIFPNVSLSTRCKIINRLARNIKSEQSAEHFFHFTKHNYGSRYAEMFLPKCSLEFINAYITECKPSFHHNNSVKILINICERYPDVVVSLNSECGFHRQPLKVMGDCEILVKFLILKSKFKKGAITNIKIGRL